MFNSPYVIFFDTHVTLDYIIYLNTDLHLISHFIYLLYIFYTYSHKREAYTELLILSGCTVTLMCIATTNIFYTKPCLLTFSKPASSLAAFLLDG